MHFILPTSKMGPAASSDTLVFVYHTTQWNFLQPVTYKTVEISNLTCCNYLMETYLLNYLMEESFLRS